jgi:hypothetical protein
VLPLTAFQQAHAVIAVSADGRAAAAVATSGVLQPGRWRVLVAHGTKVQLGEVVDGYVTEVEGSPDVAACLSPDGRQVALVLPTGSGVNLTYGSPPGLHTIQLGPVGKVQACDVSKSAVTLAALDASGRVKIVSVDQSGSARDVATIKGNVNSVQFCPGTGTAVVQHGSATTIVGSTGKTKEFDATVLSGCTTTGTPWFVGSRQVSWLNAL